MENGGADPQSVSMMAECNECLPGEVCWDIVGPALDTEDIAGEEQSDSIEDWEASEGLEKSYQAEISRGGQNEQQKLWYKRIVGAAVLLLSFYVSGLETSGSKLSTTWRPEGDFVNLKVTFMVQDSEVLVAQHKYRNDQISWVLRLEDPVSCCGL